MMAMAKVVLLLLVVFKATALENTHETDFNHELFPHSSPWPSPLSHPPFPSPPLAPSDSRVPYTLPSSPSSWPILAPYVAQELDRAACEKKCGISCNQRKPFTRNICLGICTARCHPNSLDDISCTLDCARSSTNSLRYDASMMGDRVSSCYEQCKRD